MCALQKSTARAATQSKSRAKSTYPYFKLHTSYVQRTGTSESAARCASDAFHQRTGCDARASSSTIWRASRYFSIQIASKCVSYLRSASTASVNCPPESSLRWMISTDRRLQFHACSANNTIWSWCAANNVSHLFHLLHAKLLYTLCNINEILRAACDWLRKQCVHVFSMHVAVLHAMAFDKCKSV